MAAPGYQNLRPARSVADSWDGSNFAQSLEEVRKAVEAEGQAAIDWYWREKAAKSVISRWIRFLAFFFTALAGLVPIVAQIFRNAGRLPAGFDSGPLASLCVGLAAAVLGLDKAFGFSTAWTRYVLAATTMTNLLHEFRMDWVALAAATTAPTLDQLAARIQRAREFVLAVQTVVLQETRDWANEFQSNMAQVEKDLKVRLDTIQSQIDKDTRDKAAAAEPGSLELTVTNAAAADGFTFQITFEGKAGRYAETVHHSTVWTRVDIDPGQYRVTLDAHSRSTPISTAAVIRIKPGEIAKSSITLPIVA